MTESEYRFRNKYTTAPADVHPNDAFAIKIVAVAGIALDWAAYMGFSHWTDQRVATAGDKIDGDAAKRLFPVLAMSGRGYRQ